jgi:hypothetical protein
MKKILSNNITANAKQPFIKETFEHLSDTFDLLQTTVANTFQGYLGNGAIDNCILWGCTYGFAPILGNYLLTITEGAIYLDGEIYYCPAKVVTVSSNATVPGTITTIYDAVDPILFTDGNTYNVHQTKYINWVSGGTTDIDLKTLKHINNVWKTVVLTSGQVTSTSSAVTLGATKKLSFLYQPNIQSLTLSVEILNFDFAGSSPDLIIDFEAATGISIGTLSQSQYSTGYFYNDQTGSGSKRGMIMQSLTGTDSGKLRIYDATANLDNAGTGNMHITGQITFSII